MILIGALLAVIIVLGLWEFRDHQRTIRMIPNRIHVNGTRGKSSVTRLITGGLQAGGMKTFGKTTGTKPCCIHPDGKEVPIFRAGKASIIEQLRIARRAVSHGAEALVVECMAVIPSNQVMTEKQMIHSTIGVITNARADHLDEMGPTVRDVAQALSGTIPYNGVLFTCEEQYLNVFQETAKLRKTEVVVASGSEVPDSAMNGFTYLEHKDNVALALAVCKHLGVSAAEALEGMKHVPPDPGVLRIFQIHYYEKEIKFVNAFAANDPDSYIVIWDVIKPFRAAGDKILVIVNCRKDRIQRTEALAELIASEISADHFLLVGEYTNALENKAVALGLSPSRISDVSHLNPEDIFQHVAGMTEHSSLVVGIGNIVGFGEEVVLHFTNRGSELAYRSG